jgi:hypothetical protein
MIELTEEQWARIVALLPKLKADKAKKDKAGKADLNKKSKAELIELVKELL